MVYGGDRPHRRVRAERRIVILISDGLDNRSRTSAESVINTALEKKVSFYVIHLPLFEPRDGRLAVRPPTKGFKDLAEKTGGKYFLVGDEKSALLPKQNADLTPIFHAIEEDLKSQYLLGFYIAESARDRPASIRAGLLAQASRAWLELRDTARAEEVLTLAIELSPSDVELFIDRAETRVAAGELWPAIDDLNRAIDLAPRRADVYALRAAAYRYVDSIELAFDDATRAIELAPDLPDGWLERGIIHRQRGNIAGARHDWREVLLLDADGPAGEVARANIERMELKLDDAPVNRPLGAGRRR